MSILLGFAGRRGRVEALRLRGLWGVERRYRVERGTRVGSLAFSAGPRPEVLLGGGSRLSAVVELAGGGDGVVRLWHLALVPLERVEALARQVRREAVGRGSCRRQLPPHCVSHGRHVGPRERAPGE